MSQSSGQGSDKACLSSTEALVSLPLSFLVAGVTLQTPSVREVLIEEPGGASPIGTFPVQALGASAKLLLEGNEGMKR